MRKVKFKKWIPRVLEAVGQYTITKDGTGCWESDFVNEGLFHQWANTYEEFDTGAGNYTVALIELENGEMVEVLPSKLTFIN